MFHLGVNTKKRKAYNANNKAVEKPGETATDFENTISGIQLYNKKYHEKLNHF